MRKYTNILQIETNNIAKQLGFDGNIPGLVAGLAAECGETLDIISKIECWKKIKSTDETSNLIQKLESEIADVLVYLNQIASAYSIDIEYAFIAKLEKLKSRTFKN